MGMFNINNDNEKCFRPEYAKFTRTYLDNQGNATGDEEEVECELPFPEWDFTELSNFKDIVASELDIPANVLVASRTEAGLLRISYKGDENGDLADYPTYQWNVYFMLRYPITGKEVEEALKGAKGDWLAVAVENTVTPLDGKGGEKNANYPEEEFDCSCNHVSEIVENLAIIYGMEDNEVEVTRADEDDSGFIRLSYDGDKYGDADNNPTHRCNIYYRLMGIAKTKDIDALLSQQG